jgi:hypothetical protein
LGKIMKPDTKLVAERIMEFMDKIQVKKHTPLYFAKAFILLKTNHWMSIAEVLEEVEKEWM